MAFRGDRLRLAREAKNLTQHELSRLCDFTEFQISRYENGRNEPSASSLGLMAKYLEVSTDYLLGISHEAKQILVESSLNEDEQRLLAAFRAQGWTGVIRFSTEQIDTILAVATSGEQSE